MSWQHTIVVGYLLFCCVYGTVIIGKPREPFTPRGIAFSWILMLVTAWLVVAG